MARNSVYMIYNMFDTLNKLYTHFAFKLHVVHESEKHHTVQIEPVKALTHHTHLMITYERYVFYISLMLLSAVSRLSTPI